MAVYRTDTFYANMDMFRSRLRTNELTLESSTIYHNLYKNVLSLLNSL
jgi:hypothetical protein